MRYRLLSPHHPPVLCMPARLRPVQGAHLMHQLQSGLFIAKWDMSRVPFVLPAMLVDQDHHSHHLHPMQFRVLPADHRPG